jgi:hypothetical protein
MKGPFKPKNPKKYWGNVKNIIYRSSWELKYMLDLDKDPNVVLWSSEELIIPYTCPITGRFRRYYPDFYVERKTKDGLIKSFVIEIKPLHQTKVPRKKEKSYRKFLNEAQTFAVNNAKWESAQRYCKKHGHHWLVLTEKELGTF